MHSEQLQNVFAEHVSEDSRNHNYGNCDRNHTAKFITDSHADCHRDGFRQQCDIFLMREIKEQRKTENTGHAGNHTGSNANQNFFSMML